MLAWEIPSEDWERTTIKTTRFKPGSQEQELLWSCLVNEWLLDSVALKYGPGTYKMQAGPGPYRQKNTTIHVSGPFARDAGYQAAPPMPPPPPDPNQLMAARTAQQALTGPVEPLALAQMIQAAVDTALARAQPPQPPADPSMLLLKGFEMASMMMSKAGETMKLVTAPTVEAGPRGWADVLADNLPNVLDVLKTAMLSRTPPPVAQAAPQPRPQPTLPSNQPAPHPEGQSMPFPEPPQDALPILNVMKGQASILKRYLDGPTSPEDLAAQLDGLVGPDLEPSILAAADHVAEHGPDILGHAAPEFASAKAAATLVAWARLIRSAEETQP